MGGETEKSKERVCEMYPLQQTRGFRHAEKLLHIKSTWRKDRELPVPHAEHHKSSLVTCIKRICSVTQIQGAVLLINERLKVSHTYIHRQPRQEADEG